MPKKTDQIPALREEPGWFGSFTRAQAPGAIANGTAIVKCWSEPGDTHPVGARGTVLGSLGPTPRGANLPPYFYFVEWAAHPRVAIGCNSWKIRPAEKDSQ